MHTKDIDQDHISGNELLTKKEAAKELKSSTRFIEKLTAKGILRPIRMGNFVRYRRSAIDEMLDKYQE